MKVKVVYGGFIRRAVALIVDSFLFIIPVTAVAYFLLPDFISGNPNPNSNEAAKSGIYFQVFQLAWSFLYYCVLQSYLHGTPGKKLLGLKIFTSKFAPPTFGQYVIRYFGSIVSGLFLCIGFLWSIFSDKKLTWHDMMANTVVVYTRVPVHEENRPVSHQDAA